MKSKSALLLVTGIVIGRIAGLLFAPQKGLKGRKDVLKKSKKYKKAFEETASRYKEKLAGLKDIQEATQNVKKKFT